MEAKTIHRRLENRPRTAVSGATRASLWPKDLLVFDETSMVDSGIPRPLRKSITKP
jgi:ATP-dependent exoDNAse (exonuclease V) alpha subunit